MPDFVTLSCPTCGGKLEITDDIERFACGYCGHEHIVKRGGGIVSLSPIVDDVKGIKIGVDKTAAELAIVRLTKEVEELKQSSKELLPDFYKKHNEHDTAESLEYGVYLFILSLIKKVDGYRIPILASDDRLKELIKNRVLILTIEDLDYLTEKALFDSVKPRDQKDEYYLNLVEEFSDLRMSMREFNRKIHDTKAELASNREIASSR